jgi:hypothetical protein
MNMYSLLHQSLTSSSFQHIPKTICHNLWNGCALNSPLRGMLMSMLLLHKNNEVLDGLLHAQWRAVGSAQWQTELLFELQSCSTKSGDQR